MKNSDLNNDFLPLVVLHYNEVVYYGYSESTPYGYQLEVIDILTVKVGKKSFVDGFSLENYINLDKGTMGKRGIELGYNRENNILRIPIHLN